MTSIRIQAENYQSAYDTTVGNRGSNGRRDTPFDVDITASTDVGGGSMVGWTESGEFLNYTVNVATPGTYDIVLRVASGDTDSLATMAFGGVLSNFAIGSTGGWNTWKDVRVSGVNLSAGVQNLRLDILGGRPLLNYIDVIPTGAAPAAPEPTPQPEITPPPAQAASRVEAEDYVAFVDSTSGNRGGKYRSDDVDITNMAGASNGYAVGWTQGGESLTYGFNIAAAGAYDIIVRLATDDANNGLSIGGKSISFGSTGGWNTLKDVRISGVNLSAGVQNLKLDVLAGRPILDYIEVVPAGSTSTPPANTPPVNTPPTNTPPAPSASSRAEAEDYVAFVDSTSGNRGGKYRSDDVDITNMAGASNGYAVGWTQGGESLTYGFNIAAAGAYDIIVRLATDDANNGLSIGGKSISFGSTGGWNTLKDVRISGVNLSAGVQNLKLDVLAGRPILDYIEVVPAGTGGSGPSLPPGGGTPTPPSGVIKIMPLGDSNTAGRGDRGSYRSTLQNLLAQDGFNVDFVGSSTGGASAPDRDHEGHSGFTINNISAKINSYLSKKPDVILLMLGTNDVLRDNGSGKKGGKLIEPKGASGRLNTLINKITSKLPQTKVFVASIPPLTKTSADLNQVKAFNSKVAQLVKSKGSNVKFVDMYKALSPGDLLSDKIHLTQAGSAKAAKVWRNAIASTLGSFQSTQANSSIEADSVTNASSIVGTSANDSLVGDSGANIFNGLEGDDLLRGGGGKDTFILSLGKGTDTIADFSVGEDLLALSGGLSLDQLTIAQGTGQSSDDTLVFSGNEQLVSLTGVQSDAVTSSSFTRV